MNDQVGRRLFVGFIFIGMAFVQFATEPGNPLHMGEKGMASTVFVAGLLKIILAAIDRDPKNPGAGMSPLG